MTFCVYLLNYGTGSGEQHTKAINKTQWSLAPDSPLQLVGVFIHKHIAIAFCKLRPRPDVMIMIILFKIFSLIRIQKNYEWKYKVVNQNIL